MGQKRWRFIGVFVWNMCMPDEYGLTGLVFTGTGGGNEGRGKNGDYGDENYYELLGVLPSATSKEIREAYIRKVKQYHPDNNPSGDMRNSEAFIKLKEAYDVLRDEDCRRNYDLHLERMRMFNKPRSTGQKWSRSSSGFSRKWESKNGFYSRESFYERSEEFKAFTESPQWQNSVTRILEPIFKAVFVISILLFGIAVYFKHYYNVDFKDIPNFIKDSANEKLTWNDVDYSHGSNMDPYSRDQIRDSIPESDYDLSYRYNDDNPKGTN